MLVSSSHPDRIPMLSPETIRALKYYKHEVAAYTLRQWNNAKIESERKERDRRRRRADLIAQRTAAAAASSPKTTAATHQHHHHAVRGVSDSSSDPRRPPGASGMHTSVTGASLGKQRTSGSDENENGPLMMVSRRRSERAQTTITQAPRSSYGAGSTHLPASLPVVPPHYPRHHTAAPVVQSAVGKHRQHRAHEPHRSQHQRPNSKSHSPARLGALDQTSNLPSYAFDRPTIHHLESVLATLDLDESHRPSGSASTPPIPIPPRSKEEQDQDEDSLVQSVPSNISPSSSSSSHHRPARALGFAAHLGMTSISNDDASGSIASSSVGLTDSASTSNPTSEGSSRMGSFSETGHALHNVRIALKDISEVTPMADDLDAWPIRMYGDGIRVQGDDDHVVGPLEHH